jgi:hypothetical protein
MFSPQQESRTGSAWKGGVAQTIYRYVSKCKNDKMKERKKIKTAKHF